MNNLSFDNFSDSLYSFRNYKGVSSNAKDREKMKSFLYKAINCELTERQKMCVASYFLERKKMKEIASELNISPSAVSRHIQRAISTLKKRSIYLY